MKFIRSAIKTMKYNQGRFKRKFDGVGAFICPNCGEINYIHSESKIDINSSISEVDFATIKVRIICPHCGNDFSVDLFDAIDINIVESIKLLNDKGYYTQFSCEGETMHPYILFGVDQNMKTRTAELRDAIIKAISRIPLPYSWYIDETEASKDKYPMVVIRSSALEEQERAMALEGLKNWAALLPKINDLDEYLPKNKKK